MQTNGKLTGRRVLLAGATGAVGEGIAQQLLRLGAQVVAPVRSAAGKIWLAERFAEFEDQLIPLEKPFSSPVAAAELARRVWSDWPCDAVVASIGGWWAGDALHKIDPAQWHSVMASNLEPHFSLARATIPLLATKPDSAYILLVGGAADEPMRGSGLISVTAAAVKMLGRMLLLELGSGPPAISLLQIDTPVISRTRPAGPDDWLRAEDVGLAVAKRIIAPNPGILHLRHRSEA